MSAHTRTAPSPTVARYRACACEAKVSSEDDRTVELSFSSDAEINFVDGVEVLDHRAESVDLTRLNAGGALLMNHDRRDQVGVVEKAWTDGHKGRAKVRFSASAKGQEVLQDVRDGIRTLVSVGYHVIDVVPEKRAGATIYRVMRWAPFEISLVSVPADPSVGVGRGVDEMEGEMKRKLLSPDTGGATGAAAPPAPPSGGAAAIDVGRERQSAASAERERITEIQAISARFDRAELASQFIRDGKSAADFKSAVLESLGARQESNPTPGAVIGMSDREIRQYSLVRAIRAQANRKQLDGLEREVHDEMARKLQRDAEGFFIPDDIFVGRRDLTVGTATAGGHTVATDLLGGSFIELLRNKMLFPQLGATVLSGLVGDIAIPSQTGGATAYWLGEEDALTPSDQTFGDVTLKPRRLAGATAYAKKLLAQSSIDIEAFVRNDLMKTLALARDKAALAGAGAANEPRGIMNLGGIGSVTFGSGNPSWAKVVEFETVTDDANALDGSLAYVMGPAVRGRWKSLARFSGTDTPFWDDRNSDKPVNGYRAVATKQMPAGDRVLFGNFADLILADWAGIDVVVNPYALDLQNKIRVVVHMHVDNAVRHAESFTLSTDSGNQT